MIFKLLHKVFKGDNRLIGNDKYLPRWVIFLIDAVILLIAMAVADYVALDKASAVSGKEIFQYEDYFIIVFAINIAAFAVFKTYAGVIRHSGFVDFFKIIVSLSVTVSVSIILGFVLDYFDYFKQSFRFFIFLYFTISVTLLFSFRIFVKWVYNFVRKKFLPHLSRQRTLLFGIDEDMMGIAENLMANTSLPYELVGFVTLNKRYKNIRLLGKKVLFYDHNFKKELLKSRIKCVLITPKGLKGNQFSELSDICFELKIRMYRVPGLEFNKDSKRVKGKITQIAIEDLLNREVIEIDDEKVRSTLYNKRVLVTGGAGSIGSELVRSVAAYSPAVLVIMDQAETPLHDIQLEMAEKFPHIHIECCLSDINHSQVLDMLFETYAFDVIYHAAAYKHVPMVESNSCEAVMVNVLGTMNLAKTAIKYRTANFVLISTDKAVNPTNVMGATKRAAEMYVQFLQNYLGNSGGTKFIITRFGNVLGSNGSVVRQFKKQILKGGPVTVTHPEIVRYFMTKEEACQLVLQAGVMGNGGEIFVFDMGEPVKILDLAKKMIYLSGLIPGEDVKIEFCGLRPGEKLYEELLSDDSKNLPTHHHKIMVAKENMVDINRIPEDFDTLIKLAKERNEKYLIVKLKKIVKNYKSQNSKFEILDV